MYAFSQRSDSIYPRRLESEMQSVKERREAEWSQVEGRKEGARNNVKDASKRENLVNTETRTKIMNDYGPWAAMPRSVPSNCKCNKQRQ